MRIMAVATMTIVRIGQKMMDDFIVRALIAAIGIAAMAGFIGSFVVWKRMAYFGDALSHSALLGIALGILTGLGNMVGVLVSTIVFALVMFVLQQRRWLPTDTALGILAHTALASGIIVMTTIAPSQTDISAYLFGDILSVNSKDIYFIYGTAAVVTVTLIALWPKLILMSLHEGLAKAEGIHTAWVQLIFMLLLTLVIAMAIQIAGVLLMTAFLIIPAATARSFSVSPLQMAIFASCIGILAAGGGISASLHWDMPAGPAIVLTLGVVFFTIFCLRPFTKLILK